MPHPLALLRSDDVVLDFLPDEVEETIRRRDEWLRTLPSGGGGLEFLVDDIHRWTPGDTVRVAFLGGDAALHAGVAEATKEITDVCNLTLDFGNDPVTNEFRRWRENDAAHAADIRVSFDKKGYFSLVGTDSINPVIGRPEDRIGGRPGQCSLNLGGFADRLPDNWRGVVRHEFLHALSFHHSHQNMRGPCEEAFRWADDEGYVRTKDDRGAYVEDEAGRRPGIYTYLSGYPNFWSKAKVDRNLKTEDDPNTVAGPFDRQSVMLYRFAPLFYKAPDSTCLPTGDGITLSDGDRRGLRLLYPRTAPERQSLTERRREALRAIENSVVEEPAGFESNDPAGAYARHTAAILRRSMDPAS